MNNKNFDNYIDLIYELVNTEERKTKLVALSRQLFLLDFKNEDIRKELNELDAKYKKVIGQLYDIGRKYIND